MKRAIQLGASLACANFKNLEGDIRQLEAAGVDYFHFDIMDGHFVPNFALDFTILKAVKELSRMPIVCHLMIEEPDRYVQRIVEFQPEFISIHIEATRHIQRDLAEIRRSGVRTGLVLNPGTPVSSLAYLLDDVDLITVMTVNPGFAGQELVPSTIRKLADIRRLIDSEGRGAVEIEVDGNVSFQNIPIMLKSGATRLAGGTSSIFSKERTIQEAVGTVRRMIDSAGEENACKHPSTVF